MKRLLVTSLLVTFLLASCSQALPADGETVSWAQAVDLLHGGHVTAVFQAHSLDVTLTLDSGASVHTVEPYIDAIFEEIASCGAACAGVAQATE
jgi:hypothetical protein